MDLLDLKRMMRRVSAAGEEVLIGDIYMRRRNRMSSERTPWTRRKEGASELMWSNEDDALGARRDVEVGLCGGCGENVK